MIPPICAVCFRDARSDRAAFPRPLLEHLVYFSDYEPVPGGMPGQPQGALWFCVDHLEAAKASSDLPTHRALLLMSSPSRRTAVRGRRSMRQDKGRVDGSGAERPAW